MNYLACPKLGDLFHSMILPKFLYDNGNGKADIYLCEFYDKFNAGLEHTFNELKEIIDAQDYVSSFQIFNEPGKIDVDLGSFRMSPMLANGPFWQLFLHTWIRPLPDLPRNYQWITVPKLSGYEDVLYINRSHVWNGGPMTEKTIEKYRQVMSQFSRKIFVTSETNQYDEFPLKDECELLVPNSLMEMCQIMCSCNSFLGNQSGPLAIASAMNVPRIGELMGYRAHLHYLNDNIWYDNVEFFINS
jgi:hypothetical protein